MYIVLGMLTGYIFLGSFPNVGVIGFIAVLVTMILALVISILLVTCFGLISFFIEDAKPFYWVYSKFILVLGTIFPIEFFPVWARPFLTYSPIYAVCYGPAKLFVELFPQLLYEGFSELKFASISNFIFLLCLGDPKESLYKGSYSNLLSVIISQLVYIVIAYIICKAIYKKGVKNINVNGG